MKRLYSKTDIFDKHVGKMEDIIHLILFDFSGKGQFAIQGYWKGHTT